MDIEILQTRVGELKFVETRYLINQYPPIKNVAKKMELCQK